MAEGSLHSLESEAGNISHATEQQPISAPALTIESKVKQRKPLPTSREMKERKPLPNCRPPVRRSQPSSPTMPANRVTKTKSPIRYCHVRPPPGFEHLAKKGELPLRRSQVHTPPGFKSRATRRPALVRFSQIYPPPGFEDRATEQNFASNQTLDRPRGEPGPDPTTKSYKRPSVREILLEGVAKDLGRLLREDPAEFDRQYPPEPAGPKADNAERKEISNCLSKSEKMPNSYGYKPPGDPIEEEEQWFTNIEIGTRRTIDQSQKLQSVLGLVGHPQLKFEKMPDAERSLSGPRCHDTPAADCKPSSV